MAGKEVIFYVNRIYIYLCADGVTRQRCGRHVHREPKYHPVRVWRVVPRGGKYGCFACGLGGQNVGYNDDGAGDEALGC